MLQPEDGVTRDDLIPPTEMLHDGSTSADQFVLLGEGFCQYILMPRAHLAPTASILDVGCGNGGVARALTRYISAEGRYEGLDVNSNTIAWLQQRYHSYRNFRFTHANVRNRLYNPSGRIRPIDYRFPFADASFDVVLLKSVFTHMVPDEMSAYMREVSRVLTKGGRSVITYFLLNDESLRFVERGLDAHRLVHQYASDPLCRIARPEMPEFVVAHDERRVRESYTRCGCTIADLAFGDWCGRRSLLGHQDLVVAIKE